ncbi:MAG: UDP-N-acetylmuramate dehydrogenase [Fimbriimonas sp.]
MSEASPIQTQVSLRPYTTLRAGGAAERFAQARTVDELALLIADAQLRGERTTILGWGSNVLPSDAGVRGLTVVNLTRSLRVARSGEVLADSGCSFQEVFLKTAQSRLRGLEFAVGIPGTLGGALVSNAGAYRSCVSEFLTRLEIVVDGERRWVDPSWMEFSYRDSVLRRSDSPNAVVLRVEMKLPEGEPKRIYDEAREYQRQRIGKQPPSPSAGSFFKNVQDVDLAAALPGLTDGMRKAGVVPAGFLIEAVGLKGYRYGGAALGRRHANFVLNVGGATATEIRKLALHAKRTVAARFGVELEEEVLYLGDWSGFRE